MKMELIGQQWKKQQQWHGGQEVVLVVTRQHRGKAMALMDVMDRRPRWRQHHGGMAVTRWRWWG